MNTYVIGFVPPDDKFKTMKRIWDDCETLNIDVPKHVTDFFNDEYPIDPGMEVELSHNEWSDGDMQAGIELKVEDIPKNVKVIRFYNSW